MARLGDYVSIKTGKLDANAASPDGQFPFFTCSVAPLRIDTYSYDCECVLVAGNGDLNVKYYFGKFDAYQRTYIIESKNKSVLSVPYLYCFLDKYVETLREQSIGGVIKYIKLENLTEAQIPLPDSQTQQNTVTVLSKIDTLIALQKQQLTKLDELVKSRFVELFGDPKINPKNYPIHQLSEYIDFLTSGSRGWAQYCSDDGPEWFITIKNVKDCHISVDNMQPVNAPDNAEAKRTKVQEGDLLISITADLGRTGVVTKEIAEHGAYINQHLTCIRLNKEGLNPLYVAYFMESPAGKEQFESKNQSAVKAGLNFNSINSLRLMVPPMDKQNAFVEFVKQTDKSKLTIQQGLEKLETLKKALMQQYFG
ncbi:MAG: restriction endonuclease subunit S [Oscillospiraceae bacterium]